MQYLIEENPYGWDNPWYGQPRRHAKAARKGARRRRRRNPIMANPIAMPRQLRVWTKGQGLVEAAAAAGGLAASTMLPGAVIKDTFTTGAKMGKLALALGAAVAAGMVGDSISASAGKAAVVGGLAGTVAQGLAMFTAIQIGGPKLLTGGRGLRRIAGPVTVPAREVETAIITNVT